jgi:hypothetical protein
MFATTEGAEDLKEDSAAMRERKQNAIKLLEAVKSSDENFYLSFCSWPSGG